jgi:hypothetical protein
MSTFHTTIDIEFKNHKPSRAVIMRTLGEYLKQGGKAFNLIWGENCISLDYHPSHQQWYGYGWIKEIGGDSIANELNEIRKQAIAETNKFIKDHFQFIHIGG